MKRDAPGVFQSGQTTAKMAAKILVAKKDGFIVPNAKQKQNLLVAFAKKGKVVYGKAFDIVKLSSFVNLNDLVDLEKNLQKVIEGRHNLFEKVGIKIKKYSQNTQK